jgi:hypothetical protein
MALAVLIRMFVRYIFVGVALCGTIIVMVMYAGTRVRMQLCINGMNMRSRVIVRQTMSGGGAVERHGRVRDKDAERIKSGQRERCLRSISFGQTRKHGALKSNDGSHRNPGAPPKDKV